VEYRRPRDLARDETAELGVALGGEDDRIVADLVDTDLAHVDDGGDEGEQADDLLDALGQRDRRAATLLEVLVCPESAR